MKKLKEYVVKYPEYYLLVVIMLACYRPPFSINAVGVAAVAVFTFQIVFKLRFTGNSDCEFVFPFQFLPDLRTAG
jgi:hypothetical protein